MKIKYKVRSLLGFLTATSFLGWIGGIGFKTVNEKIGVEIANISMPVFILCMFVWLIFISLTLVRNAKSIKW